MVDVHVEVKPQEMVVGRGNGGRLQKEAWEQIRR